MSSVDYGTIAIITVFTSFFAGLGSELGRGIINWVRKKLAKRLERVS